MKRDGQFWCKCAACPHRLPAGPATVIRNFWICSLWNHFGINVTERRWGGWKRRPENNLTEMDTTKVQITRVQRELANHMPSWHRVEKRESNGDSFEVRDSHWECPVSPRARYSHSTHAIESILAKRAGSISSVRGELLCFRLAAMLICFHSTHVVRTKRQWTATRELISWWAVDWRLLDC